MTEVAVGRGGARFGSVPGDDGDRQERFEQMLRQATVRIDVGDEISGTGFFVALGQIITCAHVLPADGAPFTVYDHLSEAPLRVIDQPRIDLDVDLALLRVEAPDVRPIPLLFGHYRTGNKVKAFGYTPAKPDGTEATLEVEGTEGAAASMRSTRRTDRPRQPVLVKLKGGQLVGGFSGAPLLDLTSGAVMGVLRRTRDERSDLGGLAIPVDVLSSAFDRVRSENGKVRTTNAPWWRSMSARQREEYERRDTPVARPAREVLVDVGQQDERWTVSITCPTVDADWGTEVRIDLNVLRPDVAKLFRILKATGRLDPVDQSHLVGQALAKALWSDEVQSRLRDMVADQAWTTDMTLHFRDDVDEDLRFLPWETLFLPDSAPGTRDRIRFASHERATFARSLGTVEVTRPVPASTLHVIVVRPPADPGDDRFSRAAHVVELKAEKVSAVTSVPTEPSGDDRDLDLTTTRFGLQDAIHAVRSEGHRAVVLHYVGRGRLRDGRDEILIDGGDDGPQAWLSAESFAEIFADEPPDVVVLQAAKGGDAEVPVDFTVLGPALLEAGVPAVVAFPLAVDNEAAGRFFGQFYTALGDGASVQLAVQRGRTTLESGARPWAFPALMLASPGPLDLVALQRGPTITGRSFT